MAAISNEIETLARGEDLGCRELDDDSRFTEDKPSFQRLPRQTWEAYLSEIDTSFPTIEVLPRGLQICHLFHLHQNRHPLLVDRLLLLKITDGYIAGEPL